MTGMPGFTSVGRLPVVWFLALSLLAAVTDTVDMNGQCMHSFKVWVPDQDVLNKVHRAEDKCDTMSSQLDHQVMLIKNRMLDELLLARNLTHAVEKELLEQKLADVQHKISMKDVKMDIMDLRGENRKLWETIDRGPGAGGRGQGGRGRGSGANGQQMRGEVDDMDVLVNQLKNGVGDLKAEWLLIKREVQDIKSESLGLKFTQNDMKFDAEKLKSALEGMKTDIASLKTQADEFVSMHDKMMKTLSVLKTEGTRDRLQFQMDDVRSVTNHLDDELSSLRHQFPDIRSTLEKLLAKRNVSADEISNVLAKLPDKDGIRKSERKNYIKEPKDCHDVYKNGYDTSGVYQIRPNGTTWLENAYCEMINGTGWTVVQRRLDGTVSFQRGWLEYKFGFGNPYGEFWAGNELLYKLSAQRDYVLRVDMWEWDNQRFYAEYDTFGVSSETDKYRLKIRGYKGNAGDSFSYHDEMCFSTEDSDNDHDMRNCAQSNKGGWWFNGCIGSSSLNGIYHTGWYSKGPQTTPDGIVWYTRKESALYSLKRVEIKLRPYYL